MLDLTNSATSSVFAICNLYERTALAAAPASRDEVATKLQVLEALRPQMDPRNFADVVKSILKSSVLSMLGESEQEPAALVESELPQNAVREVEHMLETFKTRNASNGFCQENGRKSTLSLLPSNRYTEARADELQINFPSS
jgi:hypothetical protein